MPEKFLNLREAGESQRLQNEFARLSDKIREVAAGAASQREAHDAIMAMLAREDIGWRKAIGFNVDEGLSLEELAEWGEQIGEAAVGNPHIKNGLKLRTAYIWQGGINYGNIPGAGGGSGSGANVEKRIQDPINQENVFGDGARQRREQDLYERGIHPVIGDESNWQLRTIPIEQLTGELRNPEFDKEVWAYRRTWSQYKPGRAQPIEKNEWVFTDLFKSKRAEFIKAGGVEVDSGVLEPVNPRQVIFIQHANRENKFLYGSPDALAATVWSRQVVDLNMDGINMSHALTKIAYKVSAGTPGQAKAAAMQIESMEGSGNSYIGGNELSMMPSAGKGYDFDSFRAVVAIMAAALSISVIALTSDPGTAGSSYGSASTLDLPTQLMMGERRKEHIAFDKRILAWLGAPAAVVYFGSLQSSTDQYRELQGAMLKINSGLYEAHESKAMLERISGNPVPDATTLTIPDGYMQPNNVESINRLDNDDQTQTAKSKPAGGSPNTDENNTTAGQGDVKSNDLRTDKVSK